MRKISYEKYRDKVLGCWAGKSIGGTVGYFEGVKEITSFSVDELLPDQMIPNDDLDIQLIWLDVLLDKGIYFTSSHLMEAWLEKYDYNFGEYATGRRNYRRGIKPPVCGVYANDFYKTGMGCPIRSEVWGLIAPGNPALAAEYAYKDGILDHEGDSVWAEQFLAAIEAEAFFAEAGGVDILNRLLDAGLEFVPKDSKTHRYIDAARKGHAKNADWKVTWRELIDQFGHPDCTYAPLNMALLVMAMLYGCLDLKKTLNITLNAAWDIDCNCSTAGALIGLIKGFEGLDPDLKGHITHEVATLARPSHDMSSLDKLTEYTARAAFTIAREKLTQVVIEDIPADLPAVPAVRYEGRVSIGVNYLGHPAISHLMDKEIELIITNNTPSDIALNLALEAPEDFTVNKTGERFTLAARESKSVPFVIGVAEGTEFLSDRNIFTAKVTGDRVEQSESFGLCAAVPLRVLGPFFDIYADWVDINRLPEERFLRTPSQTIVLPEAGEEWGNHRVRLEHPYVDEDFSGDLREKFASGKKAAAFSDSYVISDVFGFEGTCAAYFYSEIISSAHRKLEMFIGSSDPYKVWLNGELIDTQLDCRFWYPNNKVVEARFKEGVNSLVIKCLRAGKDNKLSVAFRDERTHKGFDSEHIVVDLQYGIV